MTCVVSGKVSKITSLDFANFVDSTMATADPAFCSTRSEAILSETKECEIRSTDCEGHPLLSTNELANGTPHVTSQETDGVQELPGHLTSETMHPAGQSDLSVITNVVPTTIMPSTPSELVGVRAKPPLRRVISNLDHMTGTLDQLRPIRRINSFSDIHSKQNDPLQPPAQKVRFFIGIPQNKSKLSQDDNSSETINALQDIASLSRSRMSSFKNFFRGSSKRKKRKSVEEAPDVDKLDCNCNRKSATAPSVVHDEAGKEVSALEDHVIVEPGESDDFEADLIDGTLFSKPRVSPFQRSHSTKSRMKPVIEEEDLEPRHFARSVTEGNFLYQAPTLLLTTISYPNKAPLHFPNAAERPQFSKRDLNGAKQRRGHFNRENRLWRNRSEGHSPSGPRQSIRKHVVHILTGLKKLHGDSHYQPKSSFRGLHGHSLASVELGSWAAREGRRGSTLTPFSSSLTPGVSCSRTEVLQAISSAIIHLFQRKPLKENELGILQEHVRFLINSEAGGLVQEYYKDQLLRKGMIILREKIKNEQGVELLKQLGETWDYFFKEILPVLQAILYPLTSSLSKDETVRSLTLLAFRNIVVLKVSIKEALESVNKCDYPPNISQMLLILQSIQDNVFLSENQFKLEKLVARVICPYLGQRGFYDGSPDPIIKVKLKPSPFNIPNVIISDSDKTPSKSHIRLDGPLSPSPISPRKGAYQDLMGLKKLKPVLEHVYDGGRRHSIMS